MYVHSQRSLLQNENRKLDQDILWLPASGQPANLVTKSARTKEIFSRLRCMKSFASGRATCTRKFGWEMAEHQMWARKECRFPVVARLICFTHYCDADHNDQRKHMTRVEQFETCLDQSKLVFLSIFHLMYVFVQIHDQVTTTLAQPTVKTGNTQTIPLIRKF